MAALTKNITNAVRVFGEGPSTKWGQASFPATMVWGTAKWGEYRPMIFQFVKYVTNSQPSTWAVSNLKTDYVRTLKVQTALFTFEMTSEVLKQGAWRYVFTSEASDAEDRFFPTWTEAVRPDVTFTCLPAASTTWSEV